MAQIPILTISKGLSRFEALWKISPVILVIAKKSNESQIVLFLSQLTFVIYRPLCSNKLLNKLFLSKENHFFLHDFSKEKVKAFFQYFHETTTTQCLDFSKNVTFSTLFSAQFQNMGHFSQPKIDNFWLKQKLVIF